MEKLDGKYFENTIAALKKARGEESIQIDPSFSSKLRLSIIDKAANLTVLPKFDWADLVLKYKYVLGGVPVLAVLTIVAINALNYQVKMPANQLTPESDGLVQNTLTKAPAPDTAADTTSSEPGIITFSADLVMPPAEFLNKPPTVSTEDTVPAADISNARENKLPYLFLAMEMPSLEISTLLTTKQGASGQADLQDNAIVQKGIITDTADSAQKAQNLIIAQEEALRQEQNERVEQSGTALPAPLSEQKIEDGQTADVETASQTTSAISTKSLPLTTDAVEPVTGELPATLAVPLTLTTLPEVRMQTVQYINPVEEMNQSVDKTNSQYSRSLDMVMSHYLTGDRIIYSGNDRAQVVQAILEGFSARNGALSSDYSIEVKKLEDESFKATLFEYGRVKEVLILAFRDGKLVVVTELAY